MEIQIDPHTIQRAKERGVSESEIAETIQTGTEIAGKYGRRGRWKVFPFNSTHNSKFYLEKKLEVYFITEHERIITVTVYVFYGKF